MMEFLEPQQSESIMEKGGSSGLAGVQHSWPQSCFLNVSSQAFKGLIELSAQESKQAVQNWLGITKRGDIRQGEDNDLLETAFRKLFL